MCKKILSVLLVAMMLCTLFAPVSSAYYQEDFKIESGDTIKEIWYQNAEFWGQTGAVEEGRTIGGGVSVHYIDKNKNQKADRSELLICLERGNAAGDGVGNVKDINSMKDIPLWDNLSQGAKRTVTKTLLNGYPNSKDNLGTGASKWEMLYATQILVWEFMSGERKYNDFTYEKNGPHESKGYGFEDAFISVNVNQNEELSMSIKNGKFNKALAYYKKLLKKIETHENTPEIDKIDFSGKGTKVDGASVVFEAKGSAPFSYTAEHDMFSNFTFESSNESVATVSQSKKNEDLLTIKIKKTDKTAIITATKKNSQTNHKNPENNILTPAVLVVSGSDGQVMMWGTGSLIDPVRFSFSVSAEQKYGGIGVYKVNTEKLPLSGVKFGVYGSEANAENKTKKLATITTGEDGKGYYGGTTEADFSLEEGKTYYLRELDTQPGYKLSDTIYDVEVVAGAVTFANDGDGVVNYIAEDKGAIGIVKIDESKNSVVYNPTLDILLGHKTSATFGLYADEACEILIDKGTTQANGSNVLLGVDENGKFMLESGRDYYIKELSAPYGLTPSDTVEIVRVHKNKVEYVNWDIGASQGDLAEYEVNNSLGSNHDYTNAGGFRIIPVSNRTDVKSVSVTFSYNRGTDDTPTHTVDAALNEEVAFYGIAKSSGNAIKLPENSILREGTHSVSVFVTWTYKDGSTNTKVISYPVVANRVVVHTIDDESGWVNYSYAGIKAYKYYKVHSELVQPIEGVTFGIYESFEDAQSGTANRGNEIKQITTDENGEAKLLYDGTNGLIHPYSDENPYMYYLKELSAPDNCKVSDTIYPVIVGCVDGTFVMNKSDGTIEYISDEVYDESFAEDENYIKVQESVTTRGGILGVQDIVLGNGAQLVEDKSAFATVAVENDVEIKIDVTKHCVSGADGFKFKLVNAYGETLKTYNGKYFFTDYPSDEYVPSSNYKDVILTTVADTTDNTVGYATLEGLTLSELFEEYEFFGFDEYGIIPRKLFLVENSVDGFKSVNTQVYDEWGATINYCGVIDFEQSLNHELEVTNIPYTGSVVIEKTVDTGSVEGWQFQVDYWQFKTLAELEEYFAKEESGEEISEDEIAEFEPTFSEVYSTDADGKIAIEDLYEGTVRITELEDQDVEGYDGYYCDGEYSRMVELDWKYADQARNIYTEKYSNIKRVFKIFKKDMYDYPLAGVEFTVYGTREDAEAGAESSVVITTDENGWAYFEGFGADVYFIKETKAPAGYQLSPEIKELNNSDNHWVNTEEDKANWTVINYIYAIHTGINDLGSMFSLLALPIALVTGTVGYNLYKKRKRKNLI